MTCLDNAIQADAPVPTSQVQSGVERIGEVPIYHVDGIVRRAQSLQLTRDAMNSAVVSLPGGLIEQLGLRQPDFVRISQQGGEAVLRFMRDDRLPANCARIPGACVETSGLGALFGAVEIERATAQQKASA